jgi:hypothetical protein
MFCNTYRARGIELGMHLGWMELVWTGGLLGILLSLIPHKIKLEIWLASRLIHNIHSVATFAMATTWKLFDGGGGPGTK